MARRASRDPTEEALFQTILEHPDEDAPRLVYADWLDEHGDPDRAEFIRVQCELARLPGDDSRRPALPQGEEALLRRYRKSWFKPFRKLRPAKFDYDMAWANWPTGWQWRRGFVERFFRHQHRHLRLPFPRLAPKLAHKLGRKSVSLPGQD